MRLPFRRKALTGSPQVVESLAERNMQPFIGLGGTNVNVSAIRAAFETAQSAGPAWMYRNSPAVRTVIDMIARNVAQLDLRLFEEIGPTERQPAPDHPAARSLRRPSPRQTSEQWVRAMVSDYLVFLNAYSLKFRAPGSDTLVLKWVPAQNVRILGQSLFDPDAYRIIRLDGSQFDVDPSVVIHWRGWNPVDPRLGYSPLETLRNVIAEDAALQAAIVELGKSGLAQPTWVYRPSDAPPWSNDARKGFEQDLTNRLKRRTRTPPVMEEGMELRPFGVSPQDAQMLEVRKWAVQQVATQYGVPLGMLGLADGVGADIAQARSEFYSDTLPPYCESFARQLDLSVLEEEYGESDYRFEFNLDEKHMGDDRMKALTSASGRPVMLTNEARAALNLPPVDGGDELVTPANVIVGDNPKPSTDLMPIQDPNGPPQDGSHRTASIPVGEKALEVTTERARDADMARQRRAIDAATGVFVRHYNRQAQALRSKGQKAADAERWNRELSDDLERVIRHIVEVEGATYVSRLGGHDFDIRGLENYIKAMSEGIAEGVNAATQREIDRLGLEQALSDARSQRAEVAGASVGARATVQARYEAAKQSPRSEQRMKQWVADTKRHAELNGETVALGDDFSLGFEPGGPPNCRCSLVVF